MDGSINVIGIWLGPSILVGLEGILAGIMQSSWLSWLSICQKNNSGKPCFMVLWGSFCFPFCQSIPYFLSCR